MANSDENEDQRFDRKQGESTLAWAQRVIAGNFSDPRDAKRRLFLAAKYCRVVGGASVAPLKVGHEVAITVIAMDKMSLYPTKVKQGDPARWGIGGSTLNGIAAAAGVVWEKIQRTDDRRDVHVCAFHAEGYYDTIDGQRRKIQDDADSDFRDGSPQLVGRSDGEIPQIRKNIVRATATKSQLRAIRKAFGIPHSMTEEELEKPFVFSKMIWTGRDDNPEIAMMFARVEAQKQLTAHAALFGISMSNPNAPPQLTHVPAAPLLTAAAMDNLMREDAEFEERSASAARSSGAPPPPPPSDPGGEQVGGFASPPVPPPGPPKPPGEQWMPGKKGTSKKVRDADEKDLLYWRDRLAKELDEGKTAPEYVESTKVKLAAIIEEIGIRNRKGEVIDEPNRPSAAKAAKTAEPPADKAAPAKPKSDAAQAAAIDRGDDQPGREPGDDDDSYSGGPT